VTSRASLQAIRESKLILLLILPTAGPKFWEVGSLAQLCEILLRCASASDMEEGHPFLLRLLSRQKKDPQSRVMLGKIQLEMRRVPEKGRSQIAKSRKRGHSEMAKNKPIQSKKTLTLGDQFGVTFFL